MFVCTLLHVWLFFFFSLQSIAQLHLNTHYTTRKCKVKNLKMFCAFKNLSALRVSLRNVLPLIQNLFWSCHFASVRILHTARWSTVQNMIIFLRNISMLIPALLSEDFWTRITQNYWSIIKLMIERKGNSTTHNRNCKAFHLSYLIKEAKLYYCWFLALFDILKSS